MLTSAQLKQLIEEELSHIIDTQRREALRSVRVNPSLEYRDWNYGHEGEQFPCWVVSNAPGRSVVLVFCEYGFGPESPWGALHPSDSLGMDAQWFSSLDDAFIVSGLWDGPVPNGYEVPGPRDELTERIRQMTSEMSSPE
ncbi:MAG: hypothetical protein KY468_10470 [Armatimonadetes bacterium]|nr:hypothetical protein [Armatimonadota bacterium]